jgi:hypothetical protein
VTQIVDGPKIVIDRTVIPDRPENLSRFISIVYMGHSGLLVAGIPVAEWPHVGRESD